MRIETCCSDIYNFNFCDVLFVATFNMYGEEISIRNCKEKDTELMASLLIHPGIIIRGFD